MTIGETLARARRDAGLSIVEVSDRTHIRPSIIDRIEHDNYAASGIDLFTRGEIREIAGAVGIDPKPLIEEYDATRPPAGPTPAASTSDAVRSAIGEFRQVSWMWGLALALVVVAGLGGALLILGTRGHQAASAASGRHQLSRAHARRAALPHPSSAHTGRSPGHVPSPTPSSSQVGQVLTPAGIAAFGPGGTSQGDSPQLAHLALNGNAATPWHSAWYTTPHFGNLQAGTGLLLDMGREVTVTGARLALGNGSGANLSLRIGNAPALVDLRPVADAQGAGHVIRLSSAPTRGRYVLVWFTSLPPDSAGTFQASVYDIEVLGIAD